MMTLVPVPLAEVRENDGRELQALALMRRHELHPLLRKMRETVTHAQIGILGVFVELQIVQERLETKSRLFIRAVFEPVEEFLQCREVRSVEFPALPLPFRKLKQLRLLQEVFERVHDRTGRQFVMKIQDAITGSDD